METTNASSTVEQSTSNAGLPQLSPMGAVIGVKDIEQSSRFYQSLGFQEEIALPRADGQLTVAILNFGSSTLILGRLDELHYENEVRAKQIRQGPTAVGSR